MRTTIAIFRRDTDEQTSCLETLETGDELKARREGFLKGLDLELFYTIETQGDFATDSGGYER